MYKAKRRTLRDRLSVLESEVLHLRAAMDELLACRKWDEQCREEERAIYHRAIREMGKHVAPDELLVHVGQFEKRDVELPF